MGKITGSQSGARRIGVMNRPIVKPWTEERRSLGSQFSLELGLEMKKYKGFDKCHRHPPNPTESRNIPENKFEKGPDQQEIRCKASSQRRPERWSRPASPLNADYRCERDQRAQNCRMPFLGHANSVGHAGGSESDHEHADPKNTVDPNCVIFHCAIHC